MAGIYAWRADGQVAGLASRIDRWTESLLADYIQAHPVNRNSAKDIHDAVSGRIRLNRWEVYLLDSPLLQRLRYIRQLGVAHLLFPSIGYSRFEHTIGSVHQASEIFGALKSTRPAHRPASIDSPSYEGALRIAALFHDCGHGPLSHVTEKYYRWHPEMGAAQQFLGSKYQKKPSPSEVLSILVVSSPAVSRLIEVSGFSPDEADLREHGLVDFVCACIAGSEARVAPNSYLAQIINGTIDGDKLDYMARDAYMAGTPIMLDTSRLLSKLRLTVKGPGGNAVYSLAIDVNGIRALEEALATRVFLYDKIYFHHKILAAEELIRRGLALAEKVWPDLRDPATLLQFVDDELLRLNHQFFFARSNDADANVARELFQRVCQRDLPKRSFAFGVRFLERAPKLLQALYPDLYDPDFKSSSEPARDLLKELEFDGPRAAFAQEIANLAGELGKETSVYVAWPEARRVAGGVDLQAVDADGNPTPIDVLFAADKWGDAYAANKLTGYVFADEPSAAVFLASERVFSTSAIDYDERSWKLAKVRESEIDDIRGNFSSGEINWYRHRLPPTFLRSSEATQRLKSLSPKFEAFHAPLGLQSTQMLATWLWQLRDSDLQDSGIRILEHFRIITRGSRLPILRTLADEFAGKALWCYLAKQDPERVRSSVRLGYELKDLGEDHPEARYIHEWAEVDLDSADTLLFFDDTICTGSQVKSYLGSWFGRPEWIEAERDRDKLLPENLQEVFRSKKIVFWFIVGFREAAEAVEQAAAEIGIEVRVRYAIDADGEGYTLRNVQFASSTSAERIRTLLSEKGVALLAYRSERGDDASSAALGDGGREALFAFDYTVPTCTVTALWRHDFASVPPWIPIVPRYPNDLAKELAARNFSF